MTGVIANVLRFSLPCHQRQLAAGGNQLEQETSEGLRLSEKLALFRKETNRKKCTFEERVLAGIQKAAVGRTENLVCIAVWLQLGAGWCWVPCGNVLGCVP